MRVSTRDREILETLTGKIRVLSFEQIRSAWWPSSDAARINARTRLAELVASGLLARESVLSRPLLPLADPIFRWSPGEAEPDPAPISWRLQKRWSKPPEPHVVYLATRRAAGILGGEPPGRLKNRSQVTHDIHVGGLYLKFLRENPERASGWASEDVLRPLRAGQKLPDSIVYDADGRQRLVVEFGGAYPTKRVLAFHEDCAARGLPYELW